MNKKQIIDLVDKLILELPIGKNFLFASYFADFITKNNIKVDPNGHKDDTLQRVTDFMIENQYLNFEKSNLDDSLTQKGVDAKNAGGHYKYLKKNKPKADLKNTDIVIKWILGLATLILAFYNYNLQRQNSILKKNQKTTSEILKSKNDSLTNIIQNKFIFDNADLRIIPSIKNSKTIDSKFEGEIVIVGYNNSDITLVNGNWNFKKLRFENADTIRNHQGAYKIKLDRIKNDTLNFYVKIDKKYGSRGYDSIMSYPYNSFWKLK